MQGRFSTRKMGIKPMSEIGRTFRAFLPLLPSIQLTSHTAQAIINPAEPRSMQWRHGSAHAVPVQTLNPQLKGAPSGAPGSHSTVPCMPKCSSACAPKPACSHW